MAVSYVRNLRSSEHKSSKITGPRYKDSFKLRFVYLAFADASYTIFSFVVRSFGLIVMLYFSFECIIVNLFYNAFLKVCVCYFLLNFYFSPNDSP